MKQFQQICNNLQDENEIDIMRKYGYYTKYYTTILSYK